MTGNLSHRAICMKSFLNYFTFTFKKTGRFALMKRSTAMTAILVSMGLLAAVTLVACGSAAKPDPAAALSIATPIPSTLTPSPTGTLGAFPLTLSDGLGREVALKAVPSRIVSLAPSNTEILFAVGAGDQVVGVTKYCNYPPEAQTREQVGGFSADTISVETVVALEPDLVLAIGESQRPVIEALEQVGIPVAALTANTFDDVHANIEQVGRLTGHQEEATQVVSEMQRRVETVTTAVTAVPPEERLPVFWEVWDEPLMTAGPSTFAGQAIELAGGVNIFADVTQDYPQVSTEEVVKRNPAVILGPDTHGDKLTPEQLVQRPGWDQIEAVREGRVHLIDGDIVSRPGPRLAEGLEAVAHALYPDLFK
jgi:iron complex transport system substrate-binding protein